MVRKNLETKNEVDNLNALTKQSLLFNDRLTVDLKRQRAVTPEKTILSGVLRAGLTIRDPGPERVPDLRDYGTILCEIKFFSDVKPNWQ